MVRLTDSALNVHCCLSTTHQVLKEKLGEALAQLKQLQGELARREGGGGGTARAFGVDKENAAA